MADYGNADVLVVGCGNVLFGDDGFGPAVAEQLQQRSDLPPGVQVVNVGLGVRDVLFTIALSEHRPSRIVVVDAVDEGRRPGEVVVRDVRDIPEREIGDLSMHLLPTSHLLRELHYTCGIAMSVVSVQAHDLPQEVAPGLSDVVRAAVPTACDKILEVLRAARPAGSALAEP